MYCLTGFGQRIRQCFCTQQWMRREDAYDRPAQISVLPLPFPFLAFLFAFAAFDCSFNFALAASLACWILFFSSSALRSGVIGISSSRTPTPPTLAPRIRILPSLRCSVIIGEAAGRYLNSSLYLGRQSGSAYRCGEWAWVECLLSMVKKNGTSICKRG